MIFVLGWQDLPLVPMPAIIGLSYWEFCYAVEDGEIFERDMDLIWRAITPKVAKKPSDHLPNGELLNED